MALDHLNHHYCLPLRSTVHTDCAHTLASQTPCTLCMKPPHQATVSRLQGMNGTQAGGLPELPQSQSIARLHLFLRLCCVSREVDHSSSSGGAELSLACWSNCMMGILSSIHWIFLCL